MPTAAQSSRINALQRVIPMRLALTLATLNIAAVAPDRGGSPPTRRTIASLSYLETYSATSTVKVYRGVPADILVKGHLVDLATGVEVRTASGAATTDLTVFTGTRHGGDDSSIIVEAATGPNTPLGTYQVLLHYLIEASGPDKFLVRVFDHGKVDILTIVEPSEASGTYLAGKNYTLRVGGDHVENAALFVAKT